ncbi:ATP synthase F1 subunit delta [Balneolaceae bacterium ANBcel3]|nr:ATP synthase F1 subunit delta [Balneolaceae bacterium ANBcel3]
MIVSKVAKRYASALYQEAASSGNLETVAKDLTQIRSVIDQSNELLPFLKSMIISREIKKEVLTQLFGKSVSKQTQHFILLLLNKRRELFFYEIILAFQSLYKEEKGILDVDVLVIKKPDSDQEKNLIAALKKKTGNEVQLRFIEDPSLIGGMAVKIKDTIIDGTIKNKLQKLETTFQKTGI